MEINEKAGKSFAVDAGMTVHIKGGLSVVVESGLQLSLVAGGSFVDIGPGGVSISGPQVLINSGGSPGAGPGCNISMPNPPKMPKLPSLPKLAVTAVSGTIQDATNLVKKKNAASFGSVEVGAMAGSISTGGSGGGRDRAGGVCGDRG